MDNYAHEEFGHELAKFIGFFLLLASAAGSLVMLSLGVPALIILGVFGVFVAAVGIGVLVGRLLCHFIDGDGNAALFIAWTLFLAWTIPAIGVAIAAALSQIAATASNRRWLLYCLGTLGFIASLTYASISSVEAFRAQQAKLAAERSQYAD